MSLEVVSYCPDTGEELPGFEGEDAHFKTPKGFQLRHTGGGCTTWELIHPGEFTEFEVWISNECGSTHPDPTTQYVIVGITILNPKNEFPDGDPPIIRQLFDMTEDAAHRYDVNGNYFSYGIDLEKHDLAKVITIVKDIPNNTFNKEVVLGHDKEMSRDE